MKKSQRNRIVAGSPMSVINPSSFQIYGEHKANTLRSIYSQCDLRPRKGTSILDMRNLTPDKVFRERHYPNTAKKNPMDFCLDLEWSDTAEEYCQKTSLHGLKYVGDTELSLCERLFWLVTFVMGILAAAYYITILYGRWKDNPMIISLSSKATVLETIPFPAVTICNMNGARKTVAELIDNNQSNDSESLFEKHMLHKLCGDAVKDPDLNINASWSKMKNFMIKVSQPCDAMLVKCMWRSEAEFCGNLFNPELTDEGMCCTFNKVTRSFMYRNPREQTDMNTTYPYPNIDWTPESGYPPDAPVNASPWRVFGPGKGLGLTVVLDADISDYYCSSTASVGFKVLLHSPVETPKVSEFAYFITPGEESRVEITPKIYTTTPELVNIPENKRRCVFSSERSLRFYRTYTQRNCELECQSNYTLKECRCVPFYLPKDATTRICGTADDDCVDMAKDIAEKRSPEKMNQSDWERPKDINCSCLPSCVQIFYTKQMSTGKLEDLFSIQTDFLNQKDRTYYKRNMAVVHFFFVEKYFTSFEKGEIFGFTDFLSSTGGLLGLFLGFSFMSAAEIAYFMTIKILFSKLKRKHQKDVISQSRIFKSFPFAE